jgi:hypothetical protein
LLLVCSGAVSDRWVDKLVKFSPLLFLVASNALYSVFGFNAVDPHDGARHISNALHIYNKLVSGESDKFLTAITYYDFYFPITYLFSFPFFLVFGKSFTAGSLSLSLFWLPVAYIYLWKTLTKYFDSQDWIAALVCLVVFGTSMSSSLIKPYMQDFPAMAVLVVFQYYFFGSSFFRNRKLTLIAGLIFGIGLVTKANFFLFGLIPVAFSIWFAWKEKQLFSRISNILIFFFALSAVAGIWFSVNIFHFSYEISTGVKLHGETNFPPVLSWLSFRWYYIVFFTSYGGFQTLIFLGALFVLFVNRKSMGPNLAYALVSFLFFFVIIIFFRVKDQRTLFPALALVAPVFPMFFKQFSIRNFPLFPLVVFFVIQENVYYLTGKSMLLPQVLLNPPFVVPAGFALPPTENPNLSHFVHDEMLRLNGIESPVSEIAWQGEYTPFIQRYYHEKNLGKAEKLKLPEFDASAKIIFCRDQRWPDYYLFSVSNSDSIISVHHIDNQARIKGDFTGRIKFFNQNKELIVDTSFGFAPEGKLFSMPKPIGSSQMEISFLVHHSHPMGQRVTAYYQFMGAQYDQFNIPLEVYQKDGNRIPAAIIEL